ncbi:cyclic peptide export ABC transporter [Psittacicella hinzii]|uniref:ATP-binding cassette transporter n=1 Tax=Psittacicella hinzii TaxID=2028575 RepID=A0A3A1YE10_9GAMM|nr:cyclic peptide export ABC transporter [Psittacicella hinzii]RIY35489.1 hypothetical protein CKF58_06670 [Psittacicella hinzii]
MKILIHYARTFKWSLIFIIICSILNGVASVSLLTYLSQKLLAATSISLNTLLIFLALLLVFIALQTAVQLAIAGFGHLLVFRLRKQIIKQIIDTNYQQVKIQGKAKILASLNSDIDNITRIFMHLPEIIQGIVLMICGCIYLGSLSNSLLLITIFWFAAITLVMHFIVKQVVRNYERFRKTKDYLADDYQAVLDGHRELKLNSIRAKNFYDRRLVKHADESRKTIVITDFYHYLGNNFSDIMVLALVGVIYFASAQFKLASIETATTFAVTILFLRNFIFQAVASIPDPSLGMISSNKLQDLEFVDYQEEFSAQNQLNPNWQTIRFENVTYTYPKSKDGKNKDGNFGLQPVNFTLHRGELNFLIGKNGSGKSTLSLLLSGLVEPNQGTIYVDDVAITPELLPSYRGMITSVFSDFYLFHEIATDESPEADALLDEWLKILQIEDKVQIIDRTLSTTSLSTGQRKRLALLVSIAERRSFMILDEWAADQDPNFRHIFYRQLLPMIKERGVTVFAISHDDQYFDTADRIFLINQGVLKELNNEERLTEAHLAVEHLKENG